MPGKLEGKVAIVTGSDSGIGQAIARAFAEEGADVAITWHTDEAGAQETRQAVEAAGRRALVMQVEMRDPQSIANLFAQTAEQLGTPYILVNNAGTGGGTEVAEMAYEDWVMVFETDVHGPFVACQQFIRARRAAGGQGKIINVTSVHEETPSPGGAAYCASKGALRNLTRCLTLELAVDRINVNNIAPGMIKTPMNQEAVEDPAAMAEQVQPIPFKRAGEPEEIAKLALYLASEDANYAAGQSFTLDGGLMMNWGQGA